MQFFFPPQIDSLSSAGVWRGGKPFSLSLLRLDIDFAPALLHNTTISQWEASRPERKCEVIPSHRKSAANKQ